MPSVWICGDSHWGRSSAGDDLLIVIRTVAEAFAPLLRSPLKDITAPLIWRWTPLAWFDERLTRLMKDCKLRWKASRIRLRSVHAHVTALAETTHVDEPQYHPSPGHGRGSGSGYPSKINAKDYLLNYRLILPDRDRPATMVYYPVYSKHLELRGQSVLTIKERRLWILANLMQKLIDNVAAKGEGRT